ncbi:MAG: hypothetical protein EBS48_11640, partial [Actinobacteria bacterium]|nr:hypothetical protein [Actinomycetota bacterium]
MLEHFPDGVAILDPSAAVRWANARVRQWCGGKDPSGIGFLAALGNPEVLGPEARPFHAALASGRMTEALVRTADTRYLHLHSAPLVATAGTTVTDGDHVIVSIRDVTHTILEQQKRAAIHQAGQKLADLSPAELADMTIEERIELLKSNILHYSRDLLQFDVVEIRLLDRQTGRLEPLLAEGMQPEAEARILFARTEHNGVTGYVAATGRSYACDDTTKDPLYLEGCKGAKSSLTVPLMLHDRAVALEEAVCRGPHLLVGVDDEDPLPGQRPAPLAAPMLRVGGAGRHLLPHLLDRLLDVAGVAEDALEALPDVGVVADVALHDVDRVVEDVVHRQGH